MYRKVVSALVLLIVAVGVVAVPATVTIYSQGIACVEDDVRLSLDKGINTVRIPVPAGFVPGSLGIVFDGEVISQSFHAGAADSLPAAAVGRQVEVASEDGTVYRGTLVSTSGGIVLQDETGTIHLIEKPARVSIAGEAVNLSPYLELALSAATAGKQRVRLTYLTTGFNWGMNYVGTLSADGEGLTLTGWVQLSNTTDYPFAGVDIRLVAGQVNRVEKGYSEMRAAPMAAMAPLPQEAAFEYHLYTLPAPVDLPAGRTILIPYGTYPGIPVERVYTFEGGAVEVSLKFKNDKEHGLGIPLPGGDVRLFQARADGTLFIGADTIGHTPAGEEVSLHAGSAFDITGTRTELSNVKISGSTYRASYRIELRNHKDESVTVIVLEHPAGRAWKITKASQPYTQPDSGTIKFVVEVPADGESEVTYTVEYSY